MTTTYHPGDQPDFEQQITGERTTVRITVDSVHGVPYGVLTMETNDPAGAMLFLDLRTMPGMTQRQALIALGDAFEQALRAHDAIEREQERQAAA